MKSAVRGELMRDAGPAVAIRQKRNVEHLWTKTPAYMVRKRRRPFLSRLKVMGGRAQEP